VASGCQIPIRVADLGDQEPAAVAGEQLVGHRLAVEGDLLDLGDLPDPGLVGVRDVEEPEEAVATGREFGGDGLRRPHPPVGVDTERGVEFGDHHRIGGGTALPGPGGQRRPEQAQRDGDQRDQPRETAAQ
jgi:hypothetical protein